MTQPPEQLREQARNHLGLAALSLLVQPGAAPEAARQLQLATAAAKALSKARDRLPAGDWENLVKEGQAVRQALKRRQQAAEPEDAPATEPWIPAGDGWGAVKTVAGRQYAYHAGPGGQHWLWGYTEPGAEPRWHPQRYPTPEEARAAAEQSLEDYQTGNPA